MTAEIEVQLDSPVGPRVLADDGVDLETITCSLPSGWSLSETPAVRTDTGQWSYPLVRDAGPYQLKTVRRVTLYVLRPGQQWNGLRLPEYAVTNSVKPGDTVLENFEVVVRETRGIRTRGDKAYWDGTVEERVQVEALPAGLEPQHPELQLHKMVEEVALTQSPTFAGVYWQRPSRPQLQQYLTDTVEAVRKDADNSTTDTTRSALLEELDRPETPEAKAARQERAARVRRLTAVQLGLAHQPSALDGPAERSCLPHGYEWDDEVAREFARETLTSHYEGCGLSREQLLAEVSDEEVVLFVTALRG